VVVADNQKLFDQFKMTVEAKRKGEQLFNENKKVLDSMYAVLQDPKTPAPEKQRLSEQVITGREQLQDFNEKYAAEQSAQVWSRITSYMNEFAREKGYAIIVGKGTSNVLYAEDSKDITEELIVFLNKKYDGSD
jgi:outer membrane protein